MSWAPAQAAMLPGGRLHLHHGPIDLIVKAWGPGAGAAFARATARFDDILAPLAAELPELRKPVADGPRLTGPVARRMLAATRPYAPAFITPMAAVAGAVADEIVGVIAATPGVTRAYVNNGGDVALHLTPGTALSAAVASGGAARIEAADPVRGVATSGWSGRSHSFGVADSVTVLAATAAAADAAATMIANAVDLPGHPAISRAPASSLSPDSDLGERLVTTGVGALTRAEIARALSAGARRAEALLARGLIVAALITLSSETRVVGRALLKEPAHA